MMILNLSTCPTEISRDSALLAEAVARDGQSWVVLTGNEFIVGFKVHGRVNRADLSRVLASVICSSRPRFPKLP